MDHYTSLFRGSLTKAFCPNTNSGLVTTIKQRMRENSLDREFIDRDSESFNTASETISGILKQPFKRDKHVPPAGSSFLTQDPLFNKNNPSQRCKVCNAEYGVQTSKSFKKWQCQSDGKWLQNRNHAFIVWLMVIEEEACFLEAVCAD